MTPSTRKSTALAVAVAGALAITGAAHAASQDAATKPTSVDQKIQAMQAEIESLQAQLNELKQQQAQQHSAVATAAQSVSKPARRNHGKTAQNRRAAKQVATVKPPPPKKKQGITLGGAMRFQYSYEDYNTGNKRRVGDIDYDIFRLDLHGKVHGVILNAQWRWFQYMSAIQHAWVGYDFNDKSQIQVGITRIPFGNQPYNSHSYFFSSNYYLGLEDTQAAGVEYVYAGDPWNVQLAFFKNDSTGSVGGATNRINSYSYDIVGVRAPGEGIYATPSRPAGAVDSVAARVARIFKPSPDLSMEFGVSGLYGGLDDPSSRIGNYYAWALHTNIKYHRWNFQAQATRYNYTTDSHATRLAVGAYAFYDTIAARASSYTLNVAYHQPVDWGPVKGLDFYNDYSLVTNKSGGLPSTFMDVLGIGVSAGDLYTYFDFVTARNQPFIGGSMAGDGNVEHRLNINFGFYF